MRNNEDRFQKPVEQPKYNINKEMQQDTSQYRIPTDFVELPSRGMFYPKEHPLHRKGNVEIKYMTTREEDILLSPSLSEQGLTMDRLIHSLFVDKRIDPSTLLTGDRNAIIVNARKNAYGDKYEVPLECSKCGKEATAMVDLSSEKHMKKLPEDDGVEYTERGTFFVESPLRKARVEMKLLTGEDEKTIEDSIARRVQKGLPEEEVTTRYRRMIVSVDGKTEFSLVASFITTMSIFESRQLRKIYDRQMPDFQLVVSFECENKKCGHLNEGGAPITRNFFWPDN